MVLDKDMRVVTASRSFSLTFRVNRHETQGQLLFSLGAGQWDIPGMQAGDAGTMRAITRQRYTRFLHIAKHGRGLMSAVPAQFDCS